MFQPYHETGIEDVVKDVAVFKWVILSSNVYLMMCESPVWTTILIKMFLHIGNPLTQERVCMQLKKSITKTTTVSSIIMQELTKWRYHLCNLNKNSVSDNKMSE